MSIAPSVSAPPAFSTDDMLWSKLLRALTRPQHSVSPVSIEPGPIETRFRAIKWNQPPWPNQKKAARIAAKWATANVNIPSIYNPGDLHFASDAHELQKYFTMADSSLRYPDLCKEIVRRSSYLWSKDEEGAQLLHNAFDRETFTLGRHRAMRDSLWNIANVLSLRNSVKLDFFGFRAALLERLYRRGFLQQETFETIMAIYEPLLSLLEEGYLALWITKSKLYLLERPIVHTDNGQIHRDNGPAMYWRDRGPETGMGVYFWKGELLIDKLLTPSRRTIERYGDRPLRQVIEMERYGWEKIFSPGWYYRTIHASPRGVLNRINISNNIYTVLHVENQTLNQEGERDQHYLVVPNHISNVDEAVAWTYGLSEQEHQNIIRT